MRANNSCGTWYLLGINCWSKRSSTTKQLKSDAVKRVHKHKHLDQVDAATLPKAVPKTAKTMKPIEDAWLTV